MIEVSIPILGQLEKKYVSEALESNQLTQGFFIEEFEKKLGALTDSKYVISVSSGTAALHLIYLALGMKNSSKVLIPTCTFAATAFAVQYIGSEIHFVDIDQSTLNIDLNLLEDYLQKSNIKFDYLIAVDLFGNPNNFSEIINICERYGITLILDGSESLGARFDSKPVNKYSAATAISFNGNKIITTGGGGAVLTDIESVADFVRHTSKQARLNYEWYEHDQTGYNYRLSNIAAAIGLGQIENFSNILEKRKEIYNSYLKLFSENQRDFLIKPITNGESNHWLNVFTLIDLYDTKKGLQDYLLSKEIRTRSVWKPLHLQRVFKNSHSALNGNAEKIFFTSICLPSSYNLKSIEIEFVANHINKYLNNA